MDGYEEYRDRAFLDRVGLGGHAADLREFWPQGGPVWDGLAVLHTTAGRPQVLLVEGKSYPKERYGRGCQARPGSPSRALIERSLAWTQSVLGVEDRTAADWCGPLYQTANRLAHVYWLRSLGVRAWLVHLLFVADSRSPTSTVEWEAAIARADEEIGIGDLRLEFAAHVLLPAGRRNELVRSPDERGIESASRRDDPKEEPPCN